jgi:uncharacterized protein (DUF1697 family)
VNVGKGNKVPMAEFRLMLENFGYSGVKSVLNSGNAVFTATGRDAIKHARKIAGGVEKRFNVITPVIVKSAIEFDAIVDGNPVIPADSDHSRFLVAFSMEPEAIRDLEKLKPLMLRSERFIVTEHAAYIYCAEGILESKIAAAMLGKSGRHVTTRNWATILRLVSVFNENAD